MSPFLLLVICVFLNTKHGKEEDIGEYRLRMRRMTRGDAHW